MAGLGGAIGSMLRLGISVLIKPVNHFPIATLSVNCIGSFLIGIFAGMAIKESHPNLYLFLATGICGGFTTFSAFSLEGMQLLQQHKTGLYFSYALTSIISGIFLSWAGYRLCK